ncbi:MAG: Ig-like domain repeat protein, partial [Dehalococcoidia bacterium]
QADLNLGHLNNTASPSGTPSAGGSVEATASAAATALPSPLLSLTKKVSPATYGNVGDILTYTLVATNVGNVILTGVTISDPGLTVTSSVPAQGSSLAPGAIMTVIGTRTITQADIDLGHLTNTATASSGSVSATASATATAKPKTVTKTKLCSQSIILGQYVTDTATVTGVGSNSPKPTGKVTFQVSKNGGAFTDFGAVKTLSSGQATSSSYTPTTAGTYYFRAVYKGDSNYSGSQSGDTEEKLTVTVKPKTQTVTKTKLCSQSIILGKYVEDTATVTGVGSNSPKPTGTVTFQVSTDGGLTFKNFGKVKTLSSGQATSDDYYPTKAGTYYFRAIYSGDSNYIGSCSGDKEEKLIVKNK